MRALKYGFVALLAGATAADALAAPAERVQFNRRFLAIGGDPSGTDIPTEDGLGVDLDMFASGNRTVPGSYLVNVSLNEQARGLLQVEFIPASNMGSSVGSSIGGATDDAVPCITSTFLESWGVNLQAAPAATQSIALAPPSLPACIDLPAYIPHASWSYDGDKQILRVSLPQAALLRSARDAMASEARTSGMNAALLDYRFGMSRGLAQRDQSSGSSSPNAQQFLGLGSGFNWGDWRFRQFTTYNHVASVHPSGTNSGARAVNEWHAVSTSAQRDLDVINSQLLIGDGQTPGDLMEGFGFRGGLIASDAAMQPDSLQGFAPTVRGFAQTRAKVTIRQHGYSIYTAFVPPGEFIIDDLYPTGGSGDLQVTISEANGRETSFTQPYASVPTLLREGAWRYNLAAGQYRSGDSDAGGPSFVQGTLVHGMPSDVTLFGGGLIAPMQKTVMLGAGKNIPSVGALSVDLTQSITNLVAQSFTAPHAYSGSAVRMLYARTFNNDAMPGSSSFRVAASRYLNSQFRTFSQAVAVNESQAFSADQSIARKNDTLLELSQQVGRTGSLNFSVNNQRYWYSARADRYLQMAWTSNAGPAQYSVFVSGGHARRDVVSHRHVMDIALSISLPLDSLFSGLNPSATQAQEALRGNVNYTMASRAGQGISQRASVFGNATEDHALAYSLGASVGGGLSSAPSSATASAAYQHRAGTVEASWSQSNEYRQATFSASGSVVAHEDGFTLAQSLGETIAVVSASGVEGIDFDGLPGTVTNSSGHAIIPYLAAYRNNRIAIETRDLPANVDLKSAVVSVVPRRGAIVPVKFDATRGNRIMFTLTDIFGVAVPFGAIVETESGEELGVVGPDGQAFVIVVPNAGRVHVRWGRRSVTHDSRILGCIVSYTLAEKEMENDIYQIDEICERPGNQNSEKNGEK